MKGSIFFYSHIDFHYDKRYAEILLWLINEGKEKEVVKALNYFLSNPDPAFGYLLSPKFLVDRIIVNNPEMIRKIILELGFKYMFVFPSYWIFTSHRTDVEEEKLLQVFVIEEGELSPDRAKDFVDFLTRYYRRLKRLADNSYRIVIKDRKFVESLKEHISILKKERKRKAEELMKSLILVDTES